jgi:5,10-methylenetetrahydromethanopterin reductase
VLDLRGLSYLAPLKKERARSGRTRASSRSRSAEFTGPNRANRRTMRIGTMDMTVNRGETADVVRAVAEAAAIGAASFWAPNFFGLDCLTVLAVAGTQVPTIELGTAVIPIFGRHPRVLAQQALTVHSATAQRLTLGVGLSHRSLVDGVLDTWPPSPVGYLKRFLEALMPLCALDEEKSSTPGLQIPVDRPLPVVTAALGPKTLAVAGTLSDGVVLWCVGPRTISQVTVPILSESAALVGRRAPRVVASAPVCVTNDVTTARSAIARRFGQFDALPSYQASLQREGIDSIGELALVGGRREIEEGIDRFREAGVTEFLWSDASTTRHERDASRDALGEILANHSDSS